MQRVNIQEVRLNDTNPRFIKDHKFEKLVKSIKEFPEMLDLRPIVVNQDMVVLGGNMRLRACREAGLTEVPIIQASELSDEQQNEFIIKDNSSFGEWDWDILANEWDTEQLIDWGMDIPDDWAIDEVLEAEEDNYKESIDDVETDIVLGDLIQIGNHKILCGDSTDSDQVAKLMNGELADLAHNDPPYGMKKENEGVLNDNLNFNALLEFNKDWIPLQWTHIKDNGSWYCWGIDEPLMDIYYEIIKPYQNDSKLTFRNLLTWDKETGQGQNSEVHRMFATADEKCLFIMMGKQNMVQNKDQFPEEWRPLLNYFKEERDKMGWTTKDVVKITGKTSASHYFTESQFQMPTIEHYAKMQEAAGGKAFTRSFNTLDKKGFANTSDGKSIIAEFYENRAYFDNTHDNMNNVWHFKRTSQAERQSTGGHATPKPLELCGRAIKSSCPEGGLVIDMFLGSGSTMAAAHQLNRKCYGMELDPRYCQVIINRMKNLDSTLEIKINGEIK
tara:strand:+ start:2240 stop:3742 length:1503 start_codon:yes stop_codon:yes gene_type:complete